MFIRILPCEPSLFNSDTDKQNAITNLMTSFGFRKNIIYCNDSTLESIISSSLYSDSVKKYSAELKEIRRNLGYIKNNVEFHVIVDFDNNDIEVKLNDTGNKIEIICSYLIFKEPHSALSPTLLSENRRDCKFYNTIGDLYSKNIDKGQININLQHLSGAGSECFTEYDIQIDNNYFCLCIVDNDKKHPKAGEGSTSTHFKKPQRKIIKTTENIVLNVREIESLIPLDIIEKLVVANPNHKCQYPDKVELFDTIKKHDASSNNLFRVYYDHKDGLDLKTAFELDNKYGPFWVPFFNSTCINKKPCGTQKKCINTKQNKACNSCLYIDGFGDKLLKFSLPLLEKSHLPKVKKSFTNEIEASWNQIGKKVLSWGCVLTLDKVYIT